MKYIGIEGSSYVGKTKAGEVLEARGHILVPEYSTYGPFLTYDGSIASILGAIDDLFERERTRTDFLVTSPSSTYAFADRTPLSFLTFEDMKIEFTKNKKEIADRKRALEYTINRLDNDIKIGRIIMPEIIVIMSIDDQSIFDTRVQSRGKTTVKELAEFETQLYIADRTEYYAQQLIEPDKVWRLTSDNLTADMVADRIEVLTGSRRDEN